MPRAGTQMGWLGPTLTPGRLWPGPEVGGEVVVLESGDSRDQQGVKTTFPSNQEGGDGILLERYLHSRRTSHACVLSCSSCV